MGCKPSKRHNVNTPIDDQPGSRPLSEEEDIDESSDKFLQVPTPVSVNRGGSRNSRARPLSCENLGLGKETGSYGTPSPHHLRTPNAVSDSKAKPFILMDSMDTPNNYPNDDPDEFMLIEDEGNTSPGSSTSSSSDTKMIVPAEFPTVQQVSPPTEPTNVFTRLAAKMDSQRSDAPTPYGSMNLGMNLSGQTTAMKLKDAVKAVSLDSGLDVLTDSETKLPETQRKTPKTGNTLIKPRGLIKMNDPRFNLSVKLAKEFQARVSSCKPKAKNSKIEQRTPTSTSVDTLDSVISHGIASPFFAPGMPQFRTPITSPTSSDEEPEYDLASAKKSCKLELMSWIESLDVEVEVEEQEQDGHGHIALLMPEDMENLIAKWGEESLQDFVEGGQHRKSVFNPSTVHFSALNPEQLGALISDWETHAKTEKQTLVEKDTPFECHTVDLMDLE